MEEFTEHSDVATANAILLSQKKQRLFCFACYIGVNNFYSHIIMPRHIVFLDRFKLAFEDRDKKLYCKKCRFNIEWESTKSHLECDKTTPWYTASKPISRTFFQNHTIRLTNSYYCFLCEKSLDYWDTAHLHFQEFGHMSLRSINAPDQWPENNYTVLITQGFVPGPDGTVDCKVCGKNYLTTEEMREHKVTIEHKANRVTFIANYENYKVKQSFSNKGSQSTSLDTLEESISKLVKAGPLNQDQNPEKIRVPNSGNMTFNFSQQEIPVEEIPKSKKSKKKARKVLQSLELRDTNCANNLSPKLHENHTITSQHENHTINFIVSGADELCKMAMAIARNDKQNKRKMFQQTKKEPLPYCLICFTELPGYHAVQEHLQGKRHEAARKKYGCDNIILIDGECYFCSFCERTFSGFGHVYRHITSSSHLSFVESVQENQESQCNLNRIANSMETEEAEASNESIACLFIVKQNARRSWCQICDETQLVIATKDITDHIASQRHNIALKRYGCDNIVLNANGSYSCRCCNCDIYDIDGVYLHIKEKRHMSFGHVYRNNTSSSHLSFVESAQENQASQYNLNKTANSMETEEAEALNESMACLYVVKQNAKRSWCQICDETQLAVATKNVANHIASQRHKIALQRYGCDNIVLNANGSYSCRCCNCDIYDIDGVYLHIKEKRHMSFGHVYRNNTSSSHLSLVESAQENRESQCNLNRIANSMETDEAEALNESMACLYVVKQNAKRSWCQICDETQLAVATKNIANHIASQRHNIALQRYGCDNIVLNANGSYSCRCCNCDIYDIGGVYLHIKEKRHMSSLIKVCRRQEERREKRKIETLSEDEPCNGLISKSNRSGLSNAYELSQRNMISNFTLEPNNAHCSRFPDGSEPPQQNSLHRSMDRQNSGDSGYNRLDDVYEKRSDDRLGDKGMENETPFDINSILDRIDVAKQPELRMMMSSMSAELARFLATCSTKEAKRADESQRRVERKRNPEFVGEAKKFSCTVCNAKMEDRTQLHVHMASHYTEEFARVKRSRGNEMVGNLANNRRAEVGNGSHEAQQVEQSLLEQLELGEEIANCVDNGLVDVSSHLENHDPEIMEIQTPETPEGSPREKNSQKRANLKKVAQLLEFDHDYIYDLVGKLEDVELGIMLGLVVDSSKIYCLICRRVFTYTLDKYYEHLYSVDHCNYLEEMERDNALFKDVNNQFSDMDLAKEYMQEVSDDTVRCIICDDEVANNDRALEAHIYHEIHERKCEETRAIARRCFERIAPRMHCDWYDVQKYWCVCCEMKTDSEVDFVKHLNNRKHERAMSRPENVGKKKIFDFCANCAVLWYGYRCTYSYHSTIDSHKWLERDGHYLLTELPEHAKRLLASMQQFIDHRIKFLNEIQTSERAREQHLLRDLVRVARIRFPRSKAYLYGSRVSGLGSSDSDMDIFLDCRDEYNGNSSNLTDMLFFMNGVHRSLSKESQSWDVEELLTGCRSPIIRVCHRATGINCDISFENGLAVENTQLIKTYNKIFPMCRRITLFLKQWLLYCGLLGSRQITSYALYWYVIFYLQKESILPSVAMLIALKRRSCRVAGWEVGVTHDFEYSREFSNYTLKEFLIRFFTFYAEFDFRYDVACPLLGEVVKKRSFLDIRCLPKEMEPYVDYMRGRGDPEPFRIDSPMCIQDPFDLQHNLTKAVNKVYLNRFRKCCAKSLDILWSS